MNEVVFKMVRRLPAAPAAQIVFDATFQAVDLRLEAPASFGRSAGREGLGSQFFSDGDGLLYAVLLDMNPYENVDTPPAALLQPALTHIRSSAEPGVLSLESFPSIDLVADAIWLAHPFGTALWSFNHVVLHPADRFLAIAARMQFVAIAQEAVVGIDRDTGQLQCVLVTGFDRTQRIRAEQISLDTHGKSFMERINFIHWSYYADPELEPEEPNPIEALLLDPALPHLQRELVTMYIEELGSRAGDPDDEDM